MQVSYKPANDYSLNIQLYQSFHTYQRMQSCGEDGTCTDIIRMVIVAEDGSTTTIDIPIGQGGF